MLRRTDAPPTDFRLSPSPTDFRMDIPPPSLPPQATASPPPSPSLRPGHPLVVAPREGRRRADGRKRLRAVLGRGKAGRSDGLAGARGRGRPRGRVGAAAADRPGMQTRAGVRRRPPGAGPVPWGGRDGGRGGRRCVRCRSWRGLMAVSVSVSVSVSARARSVCLREQAHARTRACWKRLKFRGAATHLARWSRPVLSGPRPSVSRGPGRPPEVQHVGTSTPIATEFRRWTGTAEVISLGRPCAMSSPGNRAGQPSA